MLCVGKAHQSIRRGSGSTQRGVKIRIFLSLIKRGDSRRNALISQVVGGKEETAVELHAAASGLVGIFQRENHCQTNFFLLVSGSPAGGDYQKQAAEEGKTKEMRV